jgi:hypothetical protein
MSERFLKDKIRREELIEEFERKHGFGAFRITQEFIKFVLLFSLIWGAEEKIK